VEKNLCGNRNPSLTNENSSMYTQTQARPEPDRDPLTPRPGRNALKNLENAIQFQASPLYAKMALSVQEAAELLGISKGMLYKMIREKQIPAVHAGRRVILSKQALLEWLKKSSMSV